MQKNSAAHRVDGTNGLATTWSHWKPSHGKNRVEDERDEHVFVERDPLTAKTTEREEKNKESKWMQTENILKASDISFIPVAFMFFFFLNLCLTCI